MKLGSLFDGSGGFPLAGADSTKYKMWGNGIALPCALHVMQGAVRVLEETR